MRLIFNFRARVVYSLPFLFQGQIEAFKQARISKGQVLYHRSGI